MLTMPLCEVTDDCPHSPQFQTAVYPLVIFVKLLYVVKQTGEIIMIGSVLVFSRLTGENHHFLGPFQSFQSA